jgi:hypothetical protein
MWMDVVMLFTCMALLLIDLQIKNDIIAQAKALQENIDEQGRTTQLDNIHPSVPGDILPCDNGDIPAVAIQAPAEAGVYGTRPRKRTSAPKRSTGDPGTRIQSDGEQVGS